MLIGIVTTLVSIAIAAAVAFAVFMVVAFLPTFIGQSGYMLVWGYVGFPLGIVLGFAAFAFLVNPVQRRVKGLLGG